MEVIFVRLVVHQILTIDDLLKHSISLSSEIKAWSLSKWLWKNLDLVVAAKMLTCRRWLWLASVSGGQVAVSLSWPQCVCEFRLFSLSVVRKYNELLRGKFCWFPVAARLLGTSRTPDLYLEILRQAAQTSVRLSGHQKKEPFMSAANICVDLSISQPFICFLRGAAKTNRRLQAKARQAQINEL